MSCLFILCYINGSRINAEGSLSVTCAKSMMTSWNGNTFRVTGHLCGKLTGHRWIPEQRPVTRSFDVLFDQRLNKRLSKQWRGWWFETPSGSLWRHCNAVSRNDRKYKYTLMATVTESPLLKNSVWTNGLGLLYICCGFLLTSWSRHPMETFSA